MIHETATSAPYPQPPTMIRELMPPGPNLGAFSYCRTPSPILKVPAPPPSVSQGFDYTPIFDLCKGFETLTSKLETKLDELTVKVNDLASKTEEIQQSQETIIRNQSRMDKDLKTLRFDQEAIIRSMITEGKNIELDKKPADPKPMPYFYPSFSAQRDFNWSLRSGKPMPFMAERINKAPHSEA